MALGQQFVDFPDADALHSTKLVHRSTGWGRFVKAAAVHFAYDVQTGCLIQGVAGLEQQAIRAGAPRLTRGIEAYSPFTYPDQQTAHLCTQHDRRMRHAGARFQHQT